MIKSHSGWIILTFAALILVLGLGGVSQVKGASTPQNDDVVGRLNALEGRVAALETENANLKAQIAAVDTKDTIRAKSIILEGDAGHVYITVDESGPRIQMMSSANESYLNLGVLNLPKIGLTPSPTLSMEFRNREKALRYSVGLYANDNGPGLDYSKVPWDGLEGSQILAEFKPDFLTLKGSRLSVDELATLTGGTAALPKQE
jgi:hypothetical protein